MGAATLTRPTATASESDALRDLPIANVRRPGDFPAEEFELIPNVPVFAEHETVSRDGRPIKFGLQELSAIVGRCNRRIDETGDYAAITIGHTPSPDEAAKGAAQPDIIGYAGPFRIGVLGQAGTKRYCILADLHVYRDELARFRRHPRRSPEVWLEDRFEEMFLDPIALLGAEAPRLDMGLLYAARYHGRQVEKYAAAAAGAVAPGPANVFIPSDDALGKRQHAADSGFSDWSVPHQATPNSEDAQMPLAPQDVEQIVDAMDRLAWVQWVKQKMQEEAGPGPGAMTPGAEGAAEGAAPAPAGVGGERPAPPAGPSPSPPVPKKDAAGEGNPEMSYPASPRKFEAGSEEEKRDKEEREEYARLRRKYEGESEEERREREDREKYDRLRRKYGGDASGEYQEVPEGGSRESINIPPGGAKPERRDYEAGGSAEGSEMQKPGSASVEPDGMRPSNGSAAGPTADGADPYRRQGPRETYAAHDRVLRLERENQAMRDQLAQQTARNVNAERYARLQSLRQHFAFDFDKTVEKTKYGRMNDEQFEDQCELLEANTRPIPFGQWLPGADQEAAAAATMAPDRPGRGAAAEKYQKQASDRALAICSAAAEQGKPVDYERVLADIQAGREPQL